MSLPRLTRNREELAMTTDMTPLIAVTIVCAIAGFRIGQHKGRPIAGLLLGLFLAVIGLVILAFVPATAQARARQSAGKQPAGKHRAGRAAPQRLAAEQAQQAAGYPSPAYPPRAQAALVPPPPGQWEPPPAP
jgi:hypothetical protein